MNNDFPSRPQPMGSSASSHLLFTGAGAPPPARTNADASLGLRLALARHSRGRSHPCQSGSAPGITCLTRHLAAAGCFGVLLLLAGVMRAQTSIVYPTAK